MTVTIAIPCFNAARWIAQCVQSALEQTWRDVEVIVVDDGSTDASIEVLASFGEMIRLLCGTHCGGNHARNEALRHARGEWVQFLDSDDFLLPEKISRQLAEAADADADCIFSPVLFDQDGRRAHSAIDAARDPATLWLAWQLPQTGGCLWRKAALEKIGGWNEATPCCQEFDLYARAIQAGLRFRYAPTPGAVYRVWSEGTLCRKDPRSTIEVRTQLYRDFIEWLRERGRLTPEHRVLAGRACFEMSRTLAKLDVKAAAEYHAARKREQLIHLAGPAAPLAYRAVYRVFGFSWAERIAAMRRPVAATSSSHAASPAARTPQELPPTGTSPRR
jgi:GT2 family glycosyltransferase